MTKDLGLGRDKSRNEEQYKARTESTLHTNEDRHREKEKKRKGRRGRAVMVVKYQQALSECRACPVLFSQSNKRGLIVNCQNAKTNLAALS